MQHELDKLLAGRRRRRRLIAIVLTLLVVSALLVLARSCASQFSEPYNKAYTPVDARESVEGSAQ